MSGNFTARQKTGLLLGPLLFLLVLVLPQPQGLTPEAAAVGAVALLMAAFWITETVPIPATAMIPIILFPLLGVMPTAEVTRSYGNQIIFLFMGGFLIAVAMQHWQLHRRIALNVILAVGSSPKRLLLGFMLATALLSMWISNTATAMMMLPVGIAVIEQTGVADTGTGKRIGDNPFGLVLMLSIAYSASVGGVATLVGTPPNAILAGILSTIYDENIGFFDWMKLGVPVSLTMLVITWLVLTTRIGRSTGPADPASVRAQVLATLEDMGPISPEERRVAVVFTLVAVSWILRGLLQPQWLSMVEDSAIAMAGAFMLFLLPTGRGDGRFILDWETAKTIPWDIIILMGGGFALAAGFSASGLTQWLAEQFTVLRTIHFFVIILAVAGAVTFLTEVTSNSATATLFIPVMGALAASIGLHPLALMVPVALAASMAFMLPVATPPNAIVFASRQVTVGQMAAVGFWLNLIAILLLSVLSYLLLPLLTSSLS